MLNVVLDLVRDGVPMAIVTHEMQFARAVADRVVLLDRGSIVEQGSLERLFAAPQTQRAKQFLNTFAFPAKVKEPRTAFADNI